VFEHNWASRTAGLVERAKVVMADLQRVLGLPVRVCPRARRLHRWPSGRAGKGRRRELFPFASEAMIDRLEETTLPLD